MSLRSKLLWNAREPIPDSAGIERSGAGNCEENISRAGALSFRSYDQTYGSIGAVIALLFWLYASAFVILLGGELNARLRERRHQM
ncbi:MAG: YihY/virulence factor BrkB family protein [Desulfuromonadales bacterium]|nr:YihY/virulence factor BrkB family protein [Desulfuromonadales bacterium]